MNEENNDVNEAQSKLAENATRRGLNMATGGAWNKVRNAPIIGNAAKRGEQKLAKKLTDNRLGRNLVNKNGIAKPNSNEDNQNDKAKPGTNDIGSKKLQNSLANRARNLWQNRKNKKKNKNGKDEKENNNQKEEKNDNSNSSNSDSNNSLEETMYKAKQRLKIKIIIYGSILFLGFAMILSILTLIFGEQVLSFVPMAGPTTYNTDSSVTTYEKGTKEYNEEIKYYKKLEDVSKQYAEEHGEKLKTNYIHAIIIYLYYFSDSDNSQDSGATVIDYSKMSNMIEKVVELIPKEDGKTIDYEINGSFYNSLKESDEIKSYYSKVLKEKEIDELLTEIFNLAESIDDMSMEDETVITEETKVAVKEVSSGSSSESKETIKNVALNDYLVDAVYAKVSESNINNSEVVKAYTVAYSTNVIAENTSVTVNSPTTTSSIETCSVTYGCSYVKQGEKQVLQTGAGEKSSLNNVFFNGKYYYKKPLTESEIGFLKKEVNSVYGKVLTSSSGSYATVSTENMKTSGDTYTDILKNNYSNYSIKDVGENTYTNGVNYGSKRILTNVIFYDQTNYSSIKFCGREKATIKTSGCGVTAMAILTSTYENSKTYDPVMMMQDAYKGGYCGPGISGTSSGFFKKKANDMNYKYLHVGKKSSTDLNLVLSHLAKNHLVIAHMGSGRFTNSGHYMVLGGVDPNEKTVYVYDPYNEINRTKNVKSGNGWYSFNDIIAKEAFGFYIIWKG